MAENCAKCGQEHVTRHGLPACSAHSARHGGPCKAPPIDGGRVCVAHGGKSRQVKAAAQARLAEAAAAKAMVTLGIERDVSPTEALLEEVRWTAGHVMWLRGKVQELEDTFSELVGVNGKHPLVWGMTEQKDVQADRYPGTDTTEAAVPSVWYQLYVKERAHLVAVCAAALKAGVEERRVRLAESQGDLVAIALGKILNELLGALVAAGLTEALRMVWEQQVPVIVPRELRAIAAEATS